MRKSLTGLVIATVFGTVAAVAATPAHADQGTTTRVSLATSTNFYPDATTRLLSRTVTLAAGESRHVRGRLEATSSTTVNALMDDIVKCVDATGTAVGVASASARNHEGSDTTYYAVPGHLPLYADLLFTAPAAGSYTCGLYGYTSSGNSSSYHLTAVAADTWLEVSDADQPGAHWWQNPTCNSTGTSGTCTYVGTSNSDAWVFYDDGTPVYKWTAASGATAVTALANLELTTCYTGTGSCDSRAVPYEKPLGTNSTVDLRFEFVQLDTTAHTCRINASTTSRRTIQDNAHHYAAYFSLSNIPIDASCGTRTFIMRVYVGYVSGNPVKIDGTQSVSLTNGIAMNQF